MYFEDCPWKDRYGASLNSLGATKMPHLYDFPKDLRFENCRDAGPFLREKSHDWRTFCLGFTARWIITGLWGSLHEGKLQRSICWSLQVTFGEGTHHEGP